MRKIRVYVSLPMKGYRREDYTVVAKEAFMRLRMLGFEPITPLENGLDEDAPVHEHMKADFRMILDSDAIYLCEGWEYSHGCMNELQVAADCRLEVLQWCMSDERIFYVKKRLEESL